MDPAQKSYVCNHVLNHERPVLLVSRLDATCQLLCGDGHDEDAFYVVGIGHIVDDDPTLLAVMDLRPEEEAERAQVGGTWTRSWIT